MEGFGCRPVKLNHIKRYDRAAAPLLGTRFLSGHADYANFPLIILPFAVVFSRARASLPGDAAPSHEIKAVDHPVS